MLRKISILLLLWTSPAWAQWDNYATGTVDNDRDGYNSDNTIGSMGVNEKDCDDSDPMIYPGVVIGAGCTNGYRTCQTDGTYTSCTSNTVTPLCEATGSGECFYVDCDSGDDSNNESDFDNPWKTARNIAASYSGTGDPPTHYRNLAAGDVVYIWGTCGNGGVYDFKPGDPGYFMGDVWLGAYGQDGTATNPITVRNYPGKSNLLDPDCSYSSQCVTIRTYISSYWIIKGLNLTGAFRSAIRMSGEGADSDNEVVNCNVYENDGDGNDNPSGVSIGNLEGTNIHHNVFYDNYTITNYGNSENTAAVYLADGTGNVIHHNTSYYTTTTGDRGDAYHFKYKVGNDDNTDTFEVKYNSMRYGRVGVGSDIAGTYVHHNYFEDVIDEAIEYRDLANYTCIDDGVFEYNTVNGSVAMEWVGNENDCTGGNYEYTFRYNVVEDDRASAYTRGNGFAGVCNSTSQCSNTFYTTFHTGGLATINYNCYYNNAAQTEMFDFFADGESSGDNYTWSEWQTEGYDANSYVTDPLLDSNNEAQAGDCSSWGWILPTSGGATPTPTPTNTPTATPTNTPTATNTPVGQPESGSIGWLQ